MQNNVQSPLDWRHRVRTHEFWVLLILVCTLVGIWVFIELAEMVNRGQTQAWDQAILLALRNPADLSVPMGPAWLSEMMRDITALGGVAVLSLLVFSVAGYLVLVRRYHLAILVVIACLGAVVADSVIKLGFNRPRPDLVPHLMVVYQSSFPSGHSMASAATYLTLGALMARVQPQLRLKVYCMALAIVTMVLVGFSRVYLGVHWPSDVLGGWTAGAVWALGCWLIGWLLTTYILRRRTDAVPPTPSSPDAATTSHNI